MATSISKEVLAIDVGTKRVGVARATTIARIPEPLTVIPTAEALETIRSLVAQRQPSTIVAGLPRDINLRETQQTRFTRQWVAELQSHINTPVVWQDEAVTSELAAEYMRTYKLPDSMLDAVAACIILGDYLATLTPGQE